MKIFEDTSEFSPITIVLETVEEARALITILNHSHELWVNQKAHLEELVEPTAGVMWSALDKADIDNYE